MVHYGSLKPYFDFIEFVYPAECEFLLVVGNADGNTAVYEQIERGDEGQIVYYPDTYVQSDWNNLESIDGHFLEIEIKE